MSTLREYGIVPDEYEYKGEIVGNYGPYIQSEREDIYKAFAKKLIEEDKAYPCFCTEDDLNRIRELQEKTKDRLGYYGHYAKCRNLTMEEVIEKINNVKQRKLTNLLKKH